MYDCELKLCTKSLLSFISLALKFPEVRWCARLRIERSGFEPWLGTLCCVLGTHTLFSQCLYPPRCINGYIPANLMLGVTLRWIYSHPIQREKKTFLVALCYENRDKLRPDGPLGSYADFAYWSFLLATKLTILKNVVRHF